MLICKHQHRNCTKTYWGEGEQNIVSKNVVFLVMKRADHC